VSKRPWSEIGEGGGFGGRGFEDGEELGDFEGALKIWAEVGEFEVSAFRFGFAMRFDQSAEAGAVYIVNMLKIDDNFGGT
jgi:hypothetical protein